MFPELITELLQDGYKVNFSAPGHSMYPTIMANETIMVEPIDPGTVRLGDIILYRTNGRLIAHRVVGINMLAVNSSSLHSDLNTQSSVLSPIHFFTFRGDASPVCDQPVKDDQILGKVISIERNGCRIDPYSFRHKIACLTLTWKSRVKRLLN
jgi:signal peptidase I